MIKTIKLLSVFIFITQLSFTSNKELLSESGKVVNLSKPHTRIISLYGAHTDVLINIGGKENLVGVDKSSADLGIEVFSYKDSVEKFLSAKPDLILIRPMIRDRFSGLIRSLKNANLTVVTIKPTKFEELDNYWLTLGRLSGHEKEAIQYTDDFHMNLAELRAKADSIPVQERKTVFFEARHKTNQTTSLEGIPAYILGVLDIDNIAYDAVPAKKGSSVADFPKELLLSRGEEIDVYLAQYGAMNRPTVDIIKKAPGYKAIRAIREGEIYIIDEYDVSRPTNGLLDGIKEIGHIVYPKYF
ncbi:MULTISPECIES: ABC transporter substrate-binding protein [Psychrilyobacter]|uniref:ABC transporter substrate-binding protein n=1 Tax=Psychrilyobacter TaxID=623282 RepID=UPI001314E56F|nr:MULTISPECIES: ABC transporter substrate-binding protein [Psychrilyobacter]MCS5421650.1 ABC transporter substrate-binding protein [Psychrilyobacter sp. S5]NDI77218.1 ABC transporter substrate-binding protein [Psychrilyobacter piezotolerans]